MYPIYHILICSLLRVLNFMWHAALEELNKFNQLFVHTDFPEHISMSIFFYIYISIKAVTTV